MTESTGPKISSLARRCSGSISLKMAGPTKNPSFFFSSRRRHTRSLRAWSSDVCSSDLLPLREAREEELGEQPDVLGTIAQRRRPQGRRVGRECRAGWRPHHKKKER